MDQRKRCRGERFLGGWNVTRKSDGPGDSQSEFPQHTTQLLTNKQKRRQLNDIWMTIATRGPASILH
jgi:hypothetical protein